MCFCAGSLCDSIELPSEHFDDMIDYLICHPSDKIPEKGSLMDKLLESKTITTSKGCAEFSHTAIKVHNEDMISEAFHMTQYVNFTYTICMVYSIPLPLLSCCFNKLNHKWNLL